MDGEGMDDSFYPALARHQGSALQRRGKTVMQTDCRQTATDCRQNCTATLVGNMVWGLCGSLAACQATDISMFPC